MSAREAPDNDDDRALRELVKRVREKREELDRYLEATMKRRRRLVRATIIGGSIAATLTAAPAVGGPTFNDWLSNIFPTAAPAWQILCAIAALCSLAATAATQLHRSNNYDERIASAQRSRAGLEVLEVGIASDRLELDEAFNRYQQVVRNASFIGHGWLC